jgi:hypothetical protein
MNVEWTVKAQTFLVSLLSSRDIRDIILYKAGGVGLESKLPLITVLIKKLDEHIQVFKA